MHEPLLPMEAVEISMLSRANLGEFLVRGFLTSGDLDPRCRVKEELASQWTCHSDGLDGCSYVYFGCGRRVAEIRLDSFKSSMVWDIWVLNAKIKQIKGEPTC
jgi:hypothetical protein